MAAPWPGLQRSNGSYRDYLKLSTRYGDAMLGYALLQHGILVKDRRLINSGIDGITYAVSRTGSDVSIESVFENMAVAAPGTSRAPTSPATSASGASTERGRATSAARVPPRSSNATATETTTCPRRSPSWSSCAVAFSRRAAARSSAAGDARHAAQPSISSSGASRDGPEGGLEPARRARIRALRSAQPPAAYQGLSAGLYARALRCCPAPRRAARARRSSASSTARGG